MGITKFRVRVDYYAVQNEIKSKTFKSNVMNRQTSINSSKHHTHQYLISLKRLR